MTITVLTGEITRSYAIVIPAVLLFGLIVLFYGHRAAGSRPAAGRRRRSPAQQSQQDQQIQRFSGDVGRKQTNIE
jgi:hypothetical protein